MAQISLHIQKKYSEDSGTTLKFVYKSARKRGWPHFWKRLFAHIAWGGPDRFGLRILNTKNYNLCIFINNFHDSKRKKIKTWIWKLSELKVGTYLDFCFLIFFSPRLRLQIISDQWNPYK